MSEVIAILDCPVPDKNNPSAFEPEPPRVEKSDPRWPVKCDHCDYIFTEDETHQSWTERLYQRSDNGELTTIRDAPVGAMWDAWWMCRIGARLSEVWRGEDGRCIVVKCPPAPGHEWMVDSRASNCTLPDDNVHRCWIRHGEPPNLTVDKNGTTCQAGAGSILIWNKDKTAYAWHGFLRNGELVEG
ncbi:MAG: hypothetical protein KGL39_39430 [Patescibacteria group bacterium]|nr:hypothetical protein [Patescibacteria group bacterium]